MNPTFKNILLISAKNAVNALITNISASQLWPLVFNLHSKSGIFNFVKLILTVIGSREVMVWLPKILKWSQTDVDTTLIQDK